MSAATEVPNRADSTSPGLSDPPSPNTPTHQLATPTTHPHSNTLSSAQNDQDDGNVGGEKSGKLIGAKTISAIKRPRKKKESETSITNNGNISTATVTDGQEAKPRKRAPRGTSLAFKKKQQRLLEEAQAREAEAHASRQTKITEAIPASSLAHTAFNVPAFHPSSQNGNNEAIQTPPVHPRNISPHSRPSSGQNYDPIRSSTVAPRPSSPMASVSTPQKVYSHTSVTHSPSISSLIDVPHSMPPYSFHQIPKCENEAKAPSPPESKRLRLSPPLLFTSPHNSNLAMKDIAPSAPHETPFNEASTMRVDTEKTQLPVNATVAVTKKPSPKASTTVSSSSHSPKPSRPKDAGITLPSGSGLLSGSIFGGNYDSTGPGRAAPTVVLDVPLTNDNPYVNFTRLAEERYGFDALHPRLAAQRERLARVAAAGTALENAHKNGGHAGTGDEMSVDLSDGEADNSNIEMGGMNESERLAAGAKSGEETGEMGIMKKPRKRTMKEDMYDKEDDFIDDTELIWEEQAATSKDGFFVYSGPLIPPGEEVTVERTDGPPKRGRGGGRGRGGTTRGGARATPKDGAKPPGRKPRITKAAKEQLEREKAQRENLAPLASKPVTQSIPS